MSERKVKREDPAHHTTDAEVLAASRKLTRRSFAVAAIGAAAGFGLYRWVDYSRDDGMQPVPLRRAFQANAALSRKVFDERALAPTYPASRAETLRINGLIGIKEAILPESWRLQLVGAVNEKKFAQYVPDVTAWTYEYSRGTESTEGDHFTFCAAGTCRESRRSHSRACRKAVSRTRRSWAELFHRTCRHTRAAARDGRHYQAAGARTCHGIQVCRGVESNHPLERRSHGRLHRSLSARAEN